MPTPKNPGKKPILFISPLPPPHGGIATWTQTITQYGLPHGQTFELINSKIRGKRDIFASYTWSIAEVRRNLTILGLLIYHLIITRPRLLHINASLSMFGLLRNLYCGLLSKLFRVPIVVHYHGNFPDYNRQRFLGLSGLILDALMRIASVNIVINESSFELSHIKKIKHKIRMLPNFIADSIFLREQQDRLGEQAAEKNGSLRALFAGGITSKKGGRELYAVAQSFPDIEFHLYGNMHADMAQAVVPANVILHGEIAHSDLLAKISDHHFLLFPSYSEGFPLTVLEVMAFGLPIIATRVGAIPQMVDEGVGGYLCAVKDTEGLCAAVKKLRELSPEQLQQMGMHNREKSFTQYRYSKVIKDLMKVYEGITNPADGLRPRGDLSHKGRG